MDDPSKSSPETADVKNVLPDVVHTQPIPALATVLTNETFESHEGNHAQNEGETKQEKNDIVVTDVSETESISEHIPSRTEYSLSASDNVAKTHESQDLLKVEPSTDKTSKNNSLNIPQLQSITSDQPSGPHSSSWPLDVNMVSEMHHISEESPVILALSSDLSKDESDCKFPSLTPQLSENEHDEGILQSDDDSRKESAKSELQENDSEKELRSAQLENVLEQESSQGEGLENDSKKESPRSELLKNDPEKELPTSELLENDSEKESLKSEFLDSLNEDKSNPQSNDSLDRDPSLERPESPNNTSSGSEEIIKLDIRGSGLPKFPFQAEKIIFGPPPEGINVEPNIQTMPVFKNLLSPFLVTAGDHVKVEEVFGSEQPSKDPTPEKSSEPSPEQSFEQKDLLVEELTVDESKEKDDLIIKEEEHSIPTQPKSYAPEETGSFSTMTTDYKTICEEYHSKLVHLEDAITQRDQLIEELTISLQRSVHDKDALRTENEHLVNEVQALQHMVCEKSQSEHDTIKAQLSDLVKYENMLKDDSTKFYSAIMSSGSSVKSSNGEKDMDREEITVNYSRSDLKSSEASDDFQTGFETKLTDTIGKFDEFIEENLKNKLRESLLQVFCDEVGKLRIEFDTEVKDIELQMQQEKQTFSVEARRLRDLLSSVKAGNADIDILRQELETKHEKEMENLRTYFEKKCSDMERSYSEDVWRGRCASSALASGSQSPDLWQEAAGDAGRRRTRSADLPSLTLEGTGLEQVLKQARQKVQVEHGASIDALQTRHREAVAALEEQIRQLKAQVQTAENTEPNVSIYPQDIDLELEKRLVQRVQQEIIQQMQDQIQVLLSDPDAELSSWPLELVALRDKIQGDIRAKDEKEVSSLRDELSLGDADKWKRRRNLSFDQNRHIEEVTKERDSLKRVASTLQHVVSQLVAYCVAAEDELNKTVLAELLTHLLPNTDSIIGDEVSRPSTPNVPTSLNNSLVSRSDKRVHFAPDLRSILAQLHEDDLVGYLEQQRDLSLDIKRELEHSLSRLRNEAQELLELSSRVGRGNRSQQALESSEVEITELVLEIDSKHRSCENCDLHKKTMEEAMAECLQRENLLRSDLEAAMIKISQLMTQSEKIQSTDLIAEGYGCCTHPVPPLSLPPRAPPPRSPPAESRSHSLDGSGSPRNELAKLLAELDLVTRERDDLQQQLEAANRQLRSTRQFVEEQAAEREVERDEFARHLAELREENAKLGTRLQNNARILNEVEQLENQTREMNQIITELEERKSTTDQELKATVEKISLLRDIIANLENQLEQKASHETEILEQLEEMRSTIDERDSKMRALLGELESLRSEKVDSSVVTCVKCSQEEDYKYAELVEKIKEQAHWLEVKIARRTHKLEGIHEVCSASCSEPSEDVSLRDQRRNHVLEDASPEGSPPTPRVENSVPELSRVWQGLDAHSRAEDAALKRIRDLEMQRARLRDVAQEVRAERDVLQSRMSEQALKISSLAARLEQQRHNAEALAHDATSQLSVQLHDSLAEVQRLKEELESKDKQLTRLRQSVDERDKLSEQHDTLYGNSCNPKDKVIILERELSAAQSRIAQLEGLARALETDKGELQGGLRDARRSLAEKEAQLQELLALGLDEDNQKEQKSDAVVEGKTSARTLSDIVSISSELDDQDLQMRRAELRAHLNISGVPHPTENKEGLQVNKTFTPPLQKANMSSLHLEHTDFFDLANFSPRADSLPINLTHKFGDSVKHSTALKIPDNCSMYPNRDISESKNLTVEPKKIDFSLEASNDHKTHDDQEFTSLRELGITLDIKQENFPDILSQLKHEIKKSKSELDYCKSVLKNAEEQLCEFPALKEEVEELKSLLENTMATMENDKKFYENQLDQFSSNKKLLEQRLSELTIEVNEKSQDLHLLKEDILRRENMVLELAKEKRNLTNKMTELEVKIDELQSRNLTLEKYESENLQMREKVAELQKLEQLVSEKNQQIDSLNQHLDRLDDLQRCLNDKTEEFDNLKEAFEEKSNELFQMQDTVEALNRDLANVHEENNKLNLCNNELKLRLTKLEKEQENQSLKLQSNENELQRVNSLNNELTSKIDELKQLTNKLKDKETEIEILHEDINAFHEEIDSLKEQLKMVSRSPSPRSKNGEEKSKPLDRQANNDKKQLVKIRKQISLLQYELDFNKRELNDKAFDLAKAKLDITELKFNLSEATKQASDKDSSNKELIEQTESLRQELQQLSREKEQLAQQMALVMARIREEASIGELRQKLRDKTEQCQALERELITLKEQVERVQSSEPLDVISSEERALVVSGTRSPTAELERALQDQLNYSHRLDEDIMEQILSASSDNEEIPRLALNSSKSSSSIHTSTSDRIHRFKSENDKLTMQVNNLEARMKDKDALITELNRIRDKLVQDWQSAKLRFEAERDNSGRLQLLLDTHKETSESLQHQDSNMIQILKKRLESSMQTELELQQAVQHYKGRVSQLERQLLQIGNGDEPLQSQLLNHELESKERLQGEISVLKCKLETSRTRHADLQALLDQHKLQHQRELDTRNQQCATYRNELAELRRLKQEARVELLRAKELLNIQMSTIHELEQKLAAAQKRPHDTLSEIEEHKSSLSREISSLKKCLLESAASDRADVIAHLRAENQALGDKLALVEEGKRGAAVPAEEKEQAIRYLHARCLRLESCRKALVWQKRYLQRALAGYHELERRLGLPSSRTVPVSRGLRRFKCIAHVVMVVQRINFLVRRRQQVRALSANCLLRGPSAAAARTNQLHADTTVYTSTSTPTHERPAHRSTPLGRPTPTGTPLGRPTSTGTPLGRSTPTGTPLGRPTPPGTPLGRPAPPETLARRVMKHELRLNLPSSPTLGDPLRSPCFNPRSPHDDPFVLNSPRGETANAYLNKLELVSRCLNHAMESSREVP